MTDHSNLFHEVAACSNCSAARGFVVEDETDSATLSRPRIACRGFPVRQLFEP
jgi:hypothetical protein